MQRIDFLKLSSLGFLGFCSCGVSHSMSTEKRLAIQLYTIRNAISENPEKALERIAELGFKDLEIYGYNGNFFGKNKKEFQTILKNTGLKVISSHHQTGVIHKESGTLLHNLEKTAEDLNFIGAKYLVCAYLLPEERTMENYKKLPGLLNTSGDLTARSGIQLAYHNHDFEFEKLNEEELIYDFILKNTSPDLVKMELDLYWITRAGLNPVDYFESYPGRFPLWHIKDMNKDTDFTEVGNGIIDFKNIFKARKKAGLAYWFLEQDSSDKDIFESIVISKQYIENNPYFFK